MKKANPIKLIAFIALLLCIYNANAQSYNNTWFTYGKPYYKFKIATDSLYRITQKTLSDLGITATGAQLQLFRNGVEVPLYVSTSGAMKSGDYVEFFGQHNDGSSDAELFQNPNDQLNKVVSFETDSATYFLTVNTSGNNLRFNTNPAATPADTASYTAEAYFFYTIQNNFSGSFNAGPFNDYSGDYVYMSDYKYKLFGKKLTTTVPVSTSFSNLYAYTAAGDVKSQISVGIAGASTYGTNRTISLSSPTQGTLISALSLGVSEGKVIVSNPFSLSGDFTASVSETNSNASDSSILGFVSLSYPRTFNFGGRKFFQFNLKGSSSKKLLHINNFNANDSVPFLYDLIDKQKYTALPSNNGFVFLLPAQDTFSLVMGVHSKGGFDTIPSSRIAQRNFTNLSSSSNQGNFLIVSHKSLINGSGSYVQQYQQYRNSTAGGSYTAKIYDIEDLEDQFAFGIRNHPLSIKNFLRYARANFSTKPTYAFLIGHGLTFNNTYGANGSNPTYQAQALLPTYGFPASDILLASDNFSPIMATPIGRLSAISSQEVGIYLNKIVAYEKDLNLKSNSIDVNIWKKNSAFVSGPGNTNEESLFGTYLNNYQNIMKAGSFGDIGYYFTNLPSSLNPSPNSYLNTLFSTGLNFISYYGHGQVTSLGYTQLSDPNNFGNAGKYPVIFVSGCDVGNCFDYKAGRTQSLANITEKFLLTPDKGSVGYMAQTSLGVTNYLHAYNLVFYQNLASTSYGKAIAYSMIEGQRKMIASIRGSDSITYLSDAAQAIFLGDPSLALFHSDKPDFAVEAAHVIAPQSVSITQSKFTVKAYLYNIGKAVGDSVQVQIQRKLASGTTETLLSKFIPSVTAIDSVQVDVPIDPDKDAGNNDIIVTIDGNNHFDELSESNNTATKTVVVYTNGLNPIYPYNYSIIHDQTAHLIASTSDALAAQQNYIMELDTTNLFNSSFKKTVNVTSVGGAIDFDPHVSYSDSMVYYWRVSPAPTAQNNLYNWAYASFQYIGTPNTDDGFGQSHVHQHEASSMQRIFLDSTSRQWYFDSIAYNFLISQLANVGSNNPPASAIGFKINGVGISSYYCTNIKNLLIFNVFTPDGMKPYFNSTSAPSVKPEASAGVSAGVGKGYMGSTASCGTSKYNFDGSSPAGPNTGKYDFEFSYQTPDNRNAIAEFMNWIPNGSYVVARLLIVNPVASVPLVGAWQTDGANSAYDAFKAQGLDLIDNFTEPNSAVFIYKKNDKSFVPVQQMTSNYNQSLQVIKDVYGKDTLGFVTSPKFGPAAKWKTLQWNGYTKDSVSTIDRATVTLIGYDANGNNPTTLGTYTTSQQNQDVSSIDAAKYPYLQMQLRNADSLLYTPYQLRYWHLLYTPVPEGALAGNIKLNAPDTINAGQDYNFTIAFKNISNKPFTDSILAKVNLTTASNDSYTIQIPNLKPLQPNDTTLISISIPGNEGDKKEQVTTFDTGMNGDNSLSVDINPGNAQPEFTHINNTLTKRFFVKTLVTPVVWSPISAVADNGKGIITWQTSTEINNNKFIILRSATGNDFDSIGEVLGAGNSATALSYKFIDNSPVEGLNYYMVKQMNFDGSYETSNIVHITIGNANKKLVIYPNPVTSSVTIGFPTADIVNVSVYNAVGRSIINITGNLPQINNIINGKLGGIVAGIYFVELADGKNIYKAKFIKR